MVVWTGSTYSATLDMEKLTTTLKFNEGLRMVSYLDKFNHMTIGYGHKLEAGTHLIISEETANLWLQEDITYAISKLDKYYPWWVNQPSDTRLVMVDLVHNLGFTGFSKFVFTIKALHLNMQYEAGVEMMDSPYARIQLPGRSRRNFKLITGVAYEPHMAE